jgi:hypothetical protein
MSAASPTELAAAKLLQEAVEGYKRRITEETMALKPLPEHDDARRALVTQFQVADAVGKHLSTLALRK